MGESAAAEVMQLNESDERDGRSRKRVLVVAKGFDVSVPEGCTVRNHVLRLESKLRDHFSSCGEIKSVCIPDVRHASTIKRYAYIEILGKNAEEKALKLSGSEMDGHKLVVTLPLRPMKRARRRALKNDRSSRTKMMIVRGYDTSLPRKIIKRALGKHFSSCGEVLEVDLYPNQTYPKARNYACVFIYGEGAKEKALQLSGSDMGVFKLVVEETFCPKPPDAGGRSPLREVWAPSYLEYMASMNKSKENPEDSKQKMQLNESDERDGRSRKRVLVVAQGFDVSVPEGCMPRIHVLRLKSMLRDVFSSCGKVKSVCIPHSVPDASCSSTISTINRYAYIDIWGIDAEEKALQLNGIEMDGHKLVVTLPLRPMERALRRALNSRRYCRIETMTVKGYDTSVPRKIMTSALGEHFSSCGEVFHVDFHVDLYPNKNAPNSDLKYACVSIYGDGAKEKALQLSGSDMGGFKLVVEETFCPKPPEAGGSSPIPDCVWASSLTFNSSAEYNLEDPNTSKRKENPNPKPDYERKEKRQKTSN